MPRFNLFSIQIFDLHSAKKEKNAHAHFLFFFSIFLVPLW